MLSKTIGNAKAQQLWEIGRMRAAGSPRRSWAIMRSSDATAGGMDFPNATHVIQVP